MSGSGSWLVAQKKACYRSTINNTSCLFPSAQANMPSFLHVLPKLFHIQKPFVLIQSLSSESHKRRFQYGTDTARQPASSNGHISSLGYRISSVFRASEPSTTQVSCISLYIHYVALTGLELRALSPPPEC